MRATSFFILVALVGCGPASRNGNGDDGTTDANPNGGGDGNPNSNGCSAAAMLVYVVDQNNQLSTFDPATKTFHDLGTLNCPATAGGTPFSMGIDRNATAWVEYSSSELFKVDTTSLACTKTSFHSSTLAQFGMGFSTDTAGGTTDTLFVAGGAGPTQPTSQLAKLDTTTMVATNVANVTGWPELTGTGNAELWGFFPSDSTGSGTPRVEKVNKATGAAATTWMLPSLQGMPTAWAFAFWGGDYWIFLMKDLEFSTTVYQIDGTNGTLKGMTNTGSRTIVGAGVSTCAPVVIL